MTREPSAFDCLAAVAGEEVERHPELKTSHRTHALNGAGIDTRNEEPVDGSLTHNIAL